MSVVGFFALMLVGSSEVPLDHEIQAVRQDQSGVTLYRAAEARAGGVLLVEVDASGWCDAPAITWMRRWRPTRRAGDNWRILLPVPLGAAGGSNLLRVHCGREEIGFSVPVWHDAFSETQLHVAPKYTRKPPPRVAAESRRIQEAWRQSNAGWFWDEPFSAPVATRITSAFGTQRVFNGKLESRHLGVDLDGEVGTPVVAANAGRVTLTANNFFYTGNAVFIDHGDQLFSVYFHLSQANVREGQMVNRGQRIGTMGRTGRVTGPHLHFGVKLDGIDVDPFELIGLELEPSLSRRITNR